MIIVINFVKEKWTNLQITDTFWVWNKNRLLLLRVHIKEVGNKYTAISKEERSFAILTY